MNHGYSTCQRGNQARRAGVPCHGRHWPPADPRRAAAPHSADGPAGRRQDPDHGADRAGVRHCAGGLHHHPPHAPERRRPAVHPGAELRRAHPQRDRVHDERDHRQRLRRHGAHRQEKRHPVHRRDQLRQRDAGPHDAAIFAVQDLRQPGCAWRLGHCGRGQSAGVQQERAGV